MNQVKTIKDIAGLGAILSVWAHPDDESFLAAGILCAAVKNGQAVACITATKGEAGSQDNKKWPPDKLATIREQELGAALKIIGVKEHHWLNYKDGCCASSKGDDAIQKIAEIITTMKPDTILTFGSDGMTGHPDHCQISSWVNDAVRRTGRKINIYHCVHTPEQYESHLKKLDQELNIFFNIEEPPLMASDKCDIHFELPKDICQLKRAALAAQPSQTELMLKLFDQTFLDKALSTEAYVKWLK